MPIVTVEEGRTMATYGGSCHCGGIAFTLDGAVEMGIDCNCSLCRRRGGLLAFFPREALVLRTPEAEVSTYTFNTHAIRHHFCPVCGVAPYSEGVDPKSGEPMVAVNLRCLPDLDLASLKIVPFDGASM
ncbi:GFA family protein [Thermomonas brevis]|nr:GFA family protein [Thermomonas brevis]